MPRISSATSRATHDASPVLRERPISTRPTMHATRDVQEAESHIVHVDSPPLEWRAASNLDAPEPRPGYVQRWIRDLVNPDSQDANWARKYAEGWRPRPVETVGAAFRFMIGATSGGVAVVRVGNSVLCEMPVQLAKQRAEHYRQKLQLQRKSAGVDDMAAAAAEGRKHGMKPMHSEDVEIKSGKGGRVPRALLDD